ncbi:hypothetical protein E3Q23_01013 [Wallemia mellicola]|uniref:Alkyl transferase n=1 Tax=Wallemia mellicola TaxID=1708541 RepID=A0A4V4MUF2_9BASI|nr:hypothetical protein E3Q23_01013 [Wallemia mellicola]TIC29743.1 Di-trans-poly-cis-decaprenylcistransferase [Wallemia mellicola]TIC68185.1 Di-trans-poly-cis-decaprenylcistransferase [Wallemia mellicola]
MTTSYPSLNRSIIPNQTYDFYKRGAVFDDWKSRILISALKLGGVPQHIGFIMDGNRRFARLHNMQISKGHEGGFIGLRRVLEFCLRLNVRCVSIYAFSIENFSRSQDEVSSLMDLASTKLDEICQHGDLIEQHNVRISVLGAKQLLNDEVRSKLEMIEKRTAGNDGAILNICMPYTSRDEMSSAMQVSGSDMKVYQKNLMTANSPPLDILIRTSGVNRFSDYLMWQASHQNTFIQVVDAFWPDIGISELVPVLLNWQRLKWSNSLSN